eukprot:8096480-Pyramimonas_sp.AAC.1
MGIKTAQARQEAQHQEIWSAIQRINEQVSLGEAEAPIWTWPNYRTGIASQIPPFSFSPARSPSPPPPFASPSPSGSKQQNWLRSSFRFIGKDRIGASSSISVE